MPVTMVPVLLSLALTGCFATSGDDRVTEGAAVYELTNGDCVVRVVSARAVDEGDVEITENCSLKASVKSSPKTQLLELWNSLP